MNANGGDTGKTNREFMVVGYGYKAVYGINVADPVKVITTEMQEYSLQTLLQVFMKVSLTLLEGHDSSNQAVQAELLKGFFPIDVRKKMVTIIREGGSPRWSFFVEQTLYNLVKLALENAGDDSQKDITGDDVEVVGRWFLLMADACMNTSGLDTGLELSVDTKTELLRAYTTRQFYLRHDERLMYRLGRYREIAKLVQLPNKYKVDVAQLFEEASGGVDIKTYLDIVFFLMAKWAIKGTAKNFDTGIVIESEEWFGLVQADDAKVNKILDLLSFTPQEYESYNTEVVRRFFGGKDEYINNFMVFMQRPLIRVTDTRYICPFSTYLAEKSSTGIYWIIEGFLRSAKREQERAKLPQVWGEAIEAYTNTRIKSFAGNDYYPNVSAGKVGEIDGILNLSNVVCFIEEKAPHISYLAQLKATPHLLAPHLGQLIGKNKQGKPKGLGQITRAIRGLRQKKWELPFDADNKKYLPIIVTEEPIHIDAFSRKYYEDFARRQGVTLEDYEVLPFIILSLEEVEYLEAIANMHGIGEVERLLVDYAVMYSRRNENGFCREAMSFKNYLYAAGYELPENGFLVHAFDEYSKTLNDYFKKQKPSETI